MKNRTIQRALVLALVLVCLPTIISGADVRPMKQLGIATITPVASTRLGTDVAVPAGTQHLIFTVSSGPVYVDFAGTASNADDPYEDGKWQIPNQADLIREARMQCDACTVKLVFWGAR
jgi:hypothetical protein